MVMVVKSNNKTYEAIQGHIRPYKAITEILYHNMPQKHIFCSLAQFLLDLEHFLLMFPRQEQEEQQEEQQEQQSFF